MKLNEITSKKVRCDGCKKLFKYSELKRHKRTNKHYCFDCQIKYYDKIKEDLL